MNFTDFKPEELVGKLVLNARGRTFSTNHSLRIAKITHVTKTGFRIEDNKNSLFGFDGWQKGLNSKADMSIYSRCDLITEEKAKDLKDKWVKQKESRAMREHITPLIAKLNHDQLTRLKAFLDGEVIT